jgi:hypothetical protein
VTLKPLAKGAEMRHNTTLGHGNKCLSLLQRCELRPVTPEVAGSSPVILASESCVRVDTEMDEILTIDEIKACYAPDWVLIGEPETDEALGLRAG